MVVETTGGDIVSFLFDTKPEMTFSGENVEIKSTSETVLYPMNTVARITFDEIAGINAADQNDVIFYFNNDELTASGLKPLSEVIVYSIDGTIRLRGNVDTNGVATLSLKDLQGGIHIVKTGNITYKIIKK